MGVAKHPEADGEPVGWVREPGDQDTGQRV